MRKSLYLFVVLVLLAAWGLMPGNLWADDPYPTRPIQVIVPFPPGGVADLVARPFTAALERNLKQPVVVVNKTGAGGAVGMQAAAVSKPDGYTLMVALSSISVMPEVDALFGRPSTYKLKDFAPVALLSADPTILVVKKESPWKTVADFVADAKKRPNEIKYSSSGVYGTMHVAMEMFAHAAGIKLRHIPTGGGGPALTSLLGGHVDALAGGPNVSIPHIKAGTLRVLAGWGTNAWLPFPMCPHSKNWGIKTSSSTSGQGSLRRWQLLRRQSRFCARPRPKPSKPPISKRPWKRWKRRFITLTLRNSRNSGIRMRRG